MMTTVAAVRALPPRVRQLLSFLLTGGFAYLVDVGVFNLLLAAGMDPVAAKCCSVAAAVVVSYAGNRYLAFATERSGRVVREAVLFVIVNVLTGATGVLCLYISHHLLGLTSPTADNISANIVGVLLGTVVRYVCYRTVVFRTPTQ